MSEEPEDRELVHLEMGLRSFSGELRCPKCESGTVKTVWHPMIIMHADPPHPCDEWVMQELLTGMVAEHLCRRCLTCNYGWPEQAADA